MGRTVISKNDVQEFGQKQFRVGNFEVKLHPQEPQKPEPISHGLSTEIPYFPGSGLPLGEPASQEDGATTGHFKILDAQAMAEIEKALKGVEEYRQKQEDEKAVIPGFEGVEDRARLGAEEFQRAMASADSMEATGTPDLAEPEVEGASGSASTSIGTRINREFTELYNSYGGGKRSGGENFGSQLLMAEPLNLTRPMPDDYVTRLVKYIPSEIIALYVTLDSIARASSAIPIGVRWLIFLFCLFGTYLYLYRVAKVHKQKQLLISSISFCVWVFAIGGPFALLGWYLPVYGGLLLPAFTFSIAIVES